MDSEKDLLSYIVKLKRGIHVPVYGLDIETELARLYMPRLSPESSDEEIMAWGAEFKCVIEPKIAAREIEMRELGELV